MKAYITLCSTESYVPGAIALDRALHAVGAKYPLFALCSKSNNARRMLEERGVNCITIESIAGKNSQNNDVCGHSNWKYTFEKLRIFGLTQFSKIVFLDSDMLIKQNIDELFDRPNLSACCAGREYGMDLGVRFNTAMIVIEPNENVMDDLLPILECEDFNDMPLSDNDIVCRKFSDWNEELLRLPDSYNMFFDLLPMYINDGVSIDDMKIIHFIGAIKPWMAGYTCPISHEYANILLEQYQNYLNTKEFYE